MLAGGIYERTSGAAGQPLEGGYRRRAPEQTHHARGCRCEAEVRIKSNYPVTVNHPGLTAWSAPRLHRVAGDEHVVVVGKFANAEDFSYFQQRIPGFFYLVGVTPVGQIAASAPANHSPRFYADEAGLPLALRSLASLTASYLAGPGSQD